MWIWQDLKEECVKLRTRVFDLEQQNRILSVLFQQRLRMSPSPAVQVRAQNLPDGPKRLGFFGCFYPRLS